MKFKAGESDEASDAKRACTDNEDNKCCYGFFLNKYSDSQCYWKKYSDFGGGKKKICFRIFVI